MAAQSLKLLAVPLGLEPMEAKLVTELPENSGWQFEPKWDGFRCLAYRAGKEVDLQAKSGKTLARYFPEIVAILAGLPQRTFVVDGELAIPTGDSLSFNALQMRIHPAESRIKQLAARKESANCHQRTFHGGQATMTPAQFFLPRGVWMGPVLRVQASSHLFSELQTSKTSSEATPASLN